MFPTASEAWQPSILETVCCTHQDFTTHLQQLELETPMGWALSAILFVAALEIILIGVCQIVGGIAIRPKTTTSERCLWMTSPPISKKSGTDVH